MTDVTPTSPTVAKTTPGSTDLASNGKTTIDDAVISKVAGIAAREVRGVHALGGGAARAIGALRDRAGQTNLSQGISVEVGETQVAVDVKLTADYPVALQKVAEDVRVAVGHAIEQIVGMDIAEINVTIADVYFASDDEGAYNDAAQKS